MQVQKPLARDLEDADAHARRRATRTGATLRVLEDYLFFPPLVKLRDLVAAGEIGEPDGGAHEDRRHRPRRLGHPRVELRAGSSNRRSTAAG